VVAIVNVTNAMRFNVKFMIFPCQKNTSKRRYSIKYKQLPLLGIITQQHA
jgi:hypothetical protein